MPDDQIVYLSQILSYPNKPYINGKQAYLFSFQMMYKSQFQKKLTLTAGFVVQGQILSNLQEGRVEFFGK